MRRILLCVCFISVTSCAELQQVVNQLPQGQPIGNAEIAEGLKQALNQGIDKQVSTLALEDGFFRNELVKILLPEELRKVDKTLRDIGLGKLADEGLKIMNRAAEDAVSEAVPVFADAVKGITFADAKTILLGQDDAATQYLQQNTEEKLLARFTPIIQNSFEKVGADKVWNSIITKYNQIPLTGNVNPNLTEYVTQEALNGVYTMIELEEKKIRTSFASRSTNLLKRVFALQD